MAERRAEMSCDDRGDAKRGKGMSWYTRFDRKIANAHYGTRSCACGTAVSAALRQMYWVTSSLFMSKIIMIASKVVA